MTENISKKSNKAAAGKADKSFWDLPVIRRALPGRGYSRFVRGMRLALPLLAVGVLGLAVAWPRVESVTKAIPKEAIIPQEKNVGSNELLNPKFESRDSKDQPFNVTAARAMQSAMDPQIVLLEKPMADITLKNGTWITVEAEKGTYRQKEEKLLLEGKVRLFQDQGYELKTEKLLVHIKDHEAWSDVVVRAQGPAGTLEASGLTLQESQNRLIFTGPVKLVLNRAVRGL